MKKVLNSNSLKIIATIAMVLDHIAYLFVSTGSVFYYVFRIIGRITAPVMFFGVANGYHYTKNKFRYGGRLLLFALLSQIPYSLFISGKIFLFDNYNVLFTLLLCFLCLYVLHNVKNIGIKCLLMVLILGISYFCEYGVFGIALVLMFSLLKDSKWKLLFYGLISFCYLIVKGALGESIVSGVILCGLFLCLPLFYLYNGEKGKLNLKYLFYIFYPLHLVILFFIKMLVF